jgi:PAS domain S-box-containing protein
MVALVLLTAIAIGMLAYRNIEVVALPRALALIDGRTRLLAVELEASVRGARADLLGFRSAALDSIVRASRDGSAEPPGGLTPDQGRARIAVRFVAELDAKPNYNKFRLIGIADGGQEIVRVDRLGPGGAIRVVPDPELKRKGDRDYLVRATRLAAGAVDVSPIRLNRGSNAGATRRIPLIHVANSIQTSDGQPFGIVMIDVDLRAAFNRIRSAGPAGASIYLTNDQGDYLIHPDRAREFGFEFGTPFRLIDDFPDLAPALAAGDAEASVVADRTGARFGIALASVRLAEGPRVTVVEAVPYSLVVASTKAVRDSTLLVGLAAVLVAVALAVGIARSLTGPLVQMTRAVETFTHEQPAQVPIEASGEIGTLARAFARMAADVRDKAAALGQEIDERHRLFDTSVDLIVVADRQGNLIRVSPSSLPILGYRPDEVVGRCSAEFIYPDDLEKARNEMRATRYGQSMRNFECRYIHKQGRVVTLAWNGLWSEPQQRYFFIGRDTTESTKAREALRESEQMARGIIDTALDAFVQIDEAGKITEWNAQAEAIFGWSREEAIGQTLGTMIVPADRQGQAQGFALFLRTGLGPILGKRLEIEARRRDGKYIQVELAVTPLRRRSGFLFNAFMRDLTAKLAAEEQLRQSQKMDAVGKLTGGVAHDFNNILTVIIGSIEILIDGLEDRPELAAIAKMIDEAAVRGANLTQQLLAFARRQPLQPRATDINAMVVGTMQLLRPTLGEQIEFESMLEDDAWRAIADPSQLSAALINIALNARDAIPNGGKLTLQTGNVVLDEAYAQANPEVKPGAYVMIAVSDTGVGIPAAIRDQVFEPFFTTKPVGKGTGLGLSMVYGFVKQSGGHVKIYSEEGVGTTIKLYLPRLVEEPRGMASLAPAATGGNETILVVEDDELVRNYVVAQLESLGYSTLSARSGAEALALAEEGANFDLLFTDVIMPGMNGRQLADELAKRRSLVKVLYTSGYAENAIVHHGRLDPGVALLNKPYRKTDLAQKIREVLAGTQRAA